MMQKKVWKMKGRMPWKSNKPSHKTRSPLTSFLFGKEKSRHAWAGSGGDRAWISR